MRKIIAPLIAGAMISSASFAGDDLKALRQEIEALKAQIAELKNSQTQIVQKSVEQEKVVQETTEKVNSDVKAVQSDLAQVKAHDAGDNIKWDIDFRTAYDDLHYKLNNAPSKDNGIWTNKLILGMSAAPVESVVFRGSLAAYKAFGQNNIAQNSYFQNFDWYDSQKPNDTAIRIREAYFLYLGNMGEVPYSVSFGRRPSTDGFLTNLRADNEKPGSPIGHNINMEFDGASFKFDFDKIASVPGLYLKLCLGRGFSDTTGAYSMNSSTMGFNPGYINDDKNPDMDLAGLIMQFYDDGQYKLMGNYFVAKNLMDMDVQGVNVGNMMTPAGPKTIQTPVFGFKDVGDMSGGALSLQVNGIGDGWSDFLDDSIFFVSYAFSKTDPNGVKLGAITSKGMGAVGGMLGSDDSKFGSSIYAGIQIPGLFKDQRFGLEYNHGSKYWRSFTYGEDTLIGSKLAARGDAYEAYYILPIVGKNLTAQLSYLYVDYDYTGSDTFFGWTGTPMDVDNTLGAIKSAQQIRASLRYRY